MLVFTFDNRETGEQRLLIAPNESEITELRTLIRKVFEDERAAQDAMLAAIPVGRAKFTAPKAFSKLSALKDRYEKLAAHRRLLQQIALQAGTRKLNML